MSVYTSCRDCGTGVLLEGGEVRDLCGECRRRRWVLALLLVGAVLAHDMLLIGLIRWIRT